LGHSEFLRGRYAGGGGNRPRPSPRSLQLDSMLIIVLRGIMMDGGQELTGDTTQAH
jgi:hypothetical protein